MTLTNQTRIRDMLAAALVIQLPKYHCGCCKDNQKATGVVADDSTATAKLSYKDRDIGKGLRIEVGGIGLNLYYTFSFGTFNWERWIYDCGFEFDSVRTRDFLDQSFGNAKNIKLIRRQIEACDAMAMEAMEEARKKYSSGGVLRYTPSRAAA